MGKASSVTIHNLFKVIDKLTLGPKSMPRSSEFRCQRRDIQGTVSKNNISTST
jgi:hypothetical protein